MENMEIHNSAWQAGTDAAIIEAALPHAFAAGEDTVCLFVATALSELNPQTGAEQRLYQLLEQAQDLDATVLILEA